MMEKLGRRGEEGSISIQKKHVRSSKQGTAAYGGHKRNKDHVKLKDLARCV